MVGGMYRLGIKLPLYDRVIIDAVDSPIKARSRAVRLCGGAFGRGGRMWLIWVWVGIGWMGADFKCLAHVH